MELWETIKLLKCQQLVKTCFSVAWTTVMFLIRFLHLYQTKPELCQRSFATYHNISHVFGAWNPKYEPLLQGLERKSLDENTSLLISKIPLEIGMGQHEMGWEGMGINLHSLTFTYLFVMLSVDIRWVICALNMDIPCGSHSKFLLKLLASIFFKSIELDACICAFSLLKILMVWDRTWNKLLRLQDLKIQTKSKVAFFNKNSQSYTSSSVSHCPSLILLHCGTEECWSFPVIWCSSLYNGRKSWKHTAYYLYNQEQRNLINIYQVLTISASLSLISNLSCPFSSLPILSHPILPHPIPSYPFPPFLSHPNGCKTTLKIGRIMLIFMLLLVFLGWLF